MLDYRMQLVNRVGTIYQDFVERDGVVLETGWVTWRECERRWVYFAL